MSIVELHARALEQTGQLMNAVDQAKFDAPTPCNGWDVRTLIIHIIEGNWWSVGVVKNDPLECETSLDEKSSGEDLYNAYQDSAQALNQLWEESSKLQQLYKVPFGKLPGSGVLNLHILELVGHGWDLAKATGQTSAYDPALVEIATQFAQRILAQRTPEVPFAKPVAISEDASAIDKLAAFLGRQV